MLKMTNFVDVILMSEYQIKLSTERTMTQLITVKRGENLSGDNGKDHLLPLKIYLFLLAPTGLKIYSIETKLKFE